jgi:ribosomal protein L12E/L44/L45/RPP1/RPP2
LLNIGSSGGATVALTARGATASGNIATEESKEEEKKEESKDYSIWA